MKKLTVWMAAFESHGVPTLVAVKAATHKAACRRLRKAGHPVSAPHQVRRATVLPGTLREMFVEYDWEAAAAFATPAANDE